MPASLGRKPVAQLPCLAPQAVTLIASVNVSVGVLVLEGLHLRGDTSVSAVTVSGGRLTLRDLIVSEYSGDGALRVSGG